MLFSPDSRTRFSHETARYSAAALHVGSMAGIRQGGTAQWPGAADRVDRGLLRGMNMDNWGDVAREMQPLGWIRGGNVQVDRRVPFMPGRSPAHRQGVGRGAARSHRHERNAGHGGGSRRNTVDPRPLFRDRRPIGNGLIGNLSRPGGNVTGFASYEPSLPASGWNS